MAHPNQGGFQRSYSSDPTLFERLFDLIDIAFPYLREMARSGPGLGPPWEAQSTPFVRFDGDIAVTHVGLWEIPFVLMGRQVRVGGIHAVCTRPEYRRRGYFRQVMQEALSYCDRRYETVLLYTAHPELNSPASVHWPISSRGCPSALTTSSSILARIGLRRRPAPSRTSSMVTHI